MEDLSSTVAISRRQPAAATTLLTTAAPPPNPLPTLLQTPAGLALLELQGTINLPGADGDEEEDSDTPRAQTVPIGRLDFPEYDPATAAASDDNSTAWMRRVQLYVGPHQRLTGEVKKLPRPLAVVRRKKQQQSASGGDGDDNDNTDLEVVEVIHYKLLFSQRPEPMTTSA